MARGILVFKYRQAAVPEANLTSGNIAVATRAAPAPTMTRLNKLDEKRFLNRLEKSRNPSIRVKKAKMGLRMEPWFHATGNRRASINLKSMAMPTIIRMGNTFRVMLQIKESQKKAIPVRIAPVWRVAHFCRPIPNANSVRPQTEPMATMRPRLFLTAEVFMLLVVLGI